MRQEAALEFRAKTTTWLPPKDAVKLFNLPREGMETHSRAHHEHRTDQTWKVKKQRGERKTKA